VAAREEGILAQSASRENDDRKKTIANKCRHRHGTAEKAAHTGRKKPCPYGPSGRDHDARARHREPSR